LDPRRVSRSVGARARAECGREAARAEEAVEQLVRLARIVDPSEQLTMIEADPADNRVLEAAAEGAVEAIVSGDSRLRTWREIAIRSPSAFLVDRRG
jgi:predicted nucleic acid-binding protein